MLQTYLSWLQDQAAGATTSTTIQYIMNAKNITAAMSSIGSLGRSGEEFGSRNTSADVNTDGVVNYAASDDDGDDGDDSGDGDMFNAEVADFSVIDTTESCAAEIRPQLSSRQHDLQPTTVGSSGDGGEGRSPPSAKGSHAVKETVMALEGGSSSLDLNTSDLIQLSRMSLAHLQSDSFDGGGDNGMKDSDRNDDDGSARKGGGKENVAVGVEVDNETEEEEVSVPAVPHLRHPRDAAMRPEQHESHRSQFDINPLKKLLSSSSGDAMTSSYSRFSSSR